MKVGAMDRTDLGEWNLLIGSLGREIGGMTSLNGFVLRYDGKGSFDSLISISGGTKLGDPTLGSTWCGDMKDDGKGFRFDISRGRG